MATYQMKVNPTIKPVQPDHGQHGVHKKQKDTGAFGKIYQEQLQQRSEVVFSKHATDRLMQRNITLSPQEMTRINQGIDRAAQKGIKETLIMMDNRAFIASVKNKTVITAAVEEQLKENVFTNIDGAVIV